MISQNKLRVVYYLNQFFGQEGQEEKADMGFLLKEGPVGPGLALQKILGERGEVVATIVCGDNYFAENLDRAAEEAIKLIAPYEPALFFAGPAFEAGRYGLSCGAICKAVQERLGIPALTGMYEDNPGVDLFRKDVYICKTERNVGKMLESLTHMVNLAFKLISEEKGTKLVSGENIGSPSEDGYFPRCILRNVYTEKTAAKRGIDLLLAKLKGKPFQTEVEMPKFETIEPPHPIKDLSFCEIALISDGGLVPRGNPNGFRSRVNTVWSAYEIESLFPEDYPSIYYEIIHTGYYPALILENPNRLVPVDVMRDLEKEGVIRKLHPLFYSTTGNTGIQTRCREMGGEIGKQLKNDRVDGAILTSTWGSSTRCGATMAAEIERAGFPVVQITAVPTVSKMIGVTRVLRGISVTSVLGDKKLPKEQEKDLRRKYVLRALEILKMDVTDTEKKQIFTLDGYE